MRTFLTTAATAVVLVALVIGGFHWQLSRLEGADVRWKTDVGPSAEAEVVGDVVLAYSRDANTMSVIDAEDGTSITVDPSEGTTEAYAGTDGSFATVGPFQVAYFSPSGEPLWTQETASQFPVVTAIGQGAVTYSDCVDKACELVQMDGQGDEKWRVDGFYPTAQNNSVVKAEAVPPPRPPQVQVAPAVPALDFDDSVQHLRGGRPVGPRLAVNEDAYFNTIAVGDTLVGVSHEGTECRYQAARDGEPLWEATADCTEADNVDLVKLVTSSERSFAVYSTEGDDKLVVSIDMATGEVSQFSLPLSANRDGDYRDFALTPQAIVSQNKREVTAYSPTTGEKLWDRTIEGQGYSSNEDADILPATTFTRGAMGVLSLTPQWTTWAVGRDAPLKTSALWDLATGDQIGRVAAKYQGSIHAEGPDQVYLVADGQVMRIDTD